MSPDLAARLVICHSYIYYILNDSIISDHEYEDLVSIVVSGWDEITDDSKRALSSAEEIAASGSHIKYHPRAVAAAKLLRSESKTS